MQNTKCGGGIYSDRLMILLHTLSTMFQSNSRCKSLGIAFISMTARDCFLCGKIAFNPTKNLRVRSQCNQAQSRNNPSNSLAIHCVHCTAFFLLLPIIQQLFKSALIPFARIRSFLVGSKTIRYLLLHSTDFPHLLSSSSSEWHQRMTR